MGYLVTNFAYGTGPYLRTTELAIAFNNELSLRGRSRMPCIVPLVYGDRQKEVMREDFGVHIEKYPEEIFLDAELGRILKQIFYTGERRFEETLSFWVDRALQVSKEARDHLSGSFQVETLDGKKREIQGKEILLEINRSPRIQYGIAPSFSTTFGYIAQILEGARALQKGEAKIDHELLRKGIKIADQVEGHQDINCMAYPATFSWKDGYLSRYPGEIMVPPITNLPKKTEANLEEGIYVTITGIEGLERLYAEARLLGLKLYSNDPKTVPGAIKALPEVIPNPAIKLQFARAGWGSIWLSMFCGTPILVPQFDPSDDPEIYFNNIAIEKLGIGMVYRGQPLQAILDEGKEIQNQQEEMCEAIRKRWGILNGNEICAKLFVDAFLGIR